ncbi:MAG: hypothetical protein ABII18_08560 [bacterium]
MRGGSWNNNAKNARSANRNNNDPENRNNNIGFRLASPAAPQHFQWKKRILQARILVFTETKSVLEGSPDWPTWFIVTKDSPYLYSAFVVHRMSKMGREFG